MLRFNRSAFALLALFLFVLSGTVLAQSPPQQFTSTFTNGGASITVNFQRHSIRSSNFSVVVQDDNGNLIPYTAGPSATYLGTPVGWPGALACATIEPDGVTLHSHIIFEDGYSWGGVTPLSGGAVGGGGTTNWQKRWPTFTIGSGGAGSNVYAADAGVDATWQYMQAHGFNIDNAIFDIENSILKTNAIYLRDASIVHRIGRIIIRGSQTRDPYEADPSLNRVKVEWGMPQSGYDLALALGPQWSGGTSAGTYIVGTYNGVSVNGSGGDFYATWRHEAGHNWGSEHYESNSSEGPTIMSDNQLARISTGELTKIVDGRNTSYTLPKLDNLGPYSFPLPPRASMDIVSDARLGASTLVDVLNNDHDGNGNAISIQSFDATSNLGGLVSRSVGTGPGGRDQLAIQPVGTPGDMDWFNYRIVDATGRTGTGIVYVRVNGYGTGLQADYFNNKTLSGAPVLTQVDNTVNFNWGSGAPASGVPADNFSVRWTGKVEARESGVHTFYLNSDDGGRLWVNGVLLVDQWVDQGATERSGTITLTAGQQYDIKVEYYDSGGGAVAELRWSSPSFAKEILPQGCLYPPNATAHSPYRPTKVAASKIWVDRTDITWDASTGASSYNVKRATAQSGPYTTIATGVTATIYSDMIANSSANYYYIVSGVNASGEGISSLPALASSSNLALNRPAVASTVAQPAARAFDGNTGTRWESDWYLDPSWIYVDLRRTYNVNNVVLNWEGAYARSYSIDVSANAVDWTPVFSTTTGNGGIDAINFAGTDARYVRMNGTQRALNYGYSLWEFEVYPTPYTLLSQGQPVTTSSTDSANPPANADDGNPATRWGATSGSYPQWWKVDLGATKDLRSVMINWYGGSGRSYKYKVEVSNDNVAFTTVVDNTGRTATGDSTDDITATGRYVRITVTGSTAGWASFYECRVYGN